MTAKGWVGRAAAMPRIHRRALGAALLALWLSPAAGAQTSETEPLAAPPELAGEALATPSAPIGLSDSVARAVEADSVDLLGSGLPEAPPLDDYRSDLERSWFAGGDSIPARSAALRLRKLELGAQAVVAPAHALLLEPGGPALGDAMLATKLAPDLPMAHVALARVHWREGDRAAAARAALAALAAVPRNLEASVWFASTAAWVLVVAVTFGALGFIALAAAMVLPRAAHDLGDLVSKHVPSFARAALLAALLLVPAVLGEGALGLVLALFAVGVVYGSSSQRIALACAATLLVVALFPAAELAGRVVSMFGADPVAHAAYAVAQGIETEHDIARLSQAEDGDTLAAHALAAHARRTGHLDDAYRRYRDLVARVPRDEVALANLASLEFRRGEIEQAVSLYSRAAALGGSAALWFDLSQVQARTFQMEEFEASLARAQSLDADAVAELSAQKDPSLLADLPLPVREIALRMFERSHGDAFADWLRSPLAPAWLGVEVQRTGLAFAAVFVAAIMLGGRFDHAGACRRCGVRICARCDGTVWNNRTCENCHRLFNHAETTESSLRAARLAALRAREVRVERAARLASLVVPGAGGMLAQRPDLALLSVLSFAFALSAWSWRAGVVPDPLALGAAGPLVWLAVAIAAAFAYVALVASSIAIRRAS